MKGLKRKQKRKKACFWLFGVQLTDNLQLLAWGSTSLLSQRHILPQPITDTLWVARSVHVCYFGYLLMSNFCSRLPVGSQETVRSASWPEVSPAQSCFLHSHFSQVLDLALKAWPVLLPCPFIFHRQTKVISPISLLSASLHLSTYTLEDHTKDHTKNSQERQVTSELYKNEGHWKLRTGHFPWNYLNQNLSAMGCGMNGRPGRRQRLQLSNLLWKFCCGGTVTK